MTHQISASTESAREAARQDTGRFGTQVRADNDGVRLAGKPPVERVSAEHIRAGDAIWIEGRPVEVEEASDGFIGERRIVVGGRRVVLREGSTHARLTGPLADDWDEAEERDDLFFYEPNSTYDVVLVSTERNSQGFTRVSAMVPGPGSYEWHARHCLADVDTPDSAPVKSPWGATRGEALARWMDEHGKDAIDKGITQRYGVDILDDGNDEDPTPQFYGVVETPGEVTDEQLVDTLDASIARYVNEMDPGTFGSEYPVWEWLSDAANTHGHPFGPDHAPAP